MKIAIPKERRGNETRVAATPDTVKRMVVFADEVAVEKGAGLSSGIPDEAFEEAGATIAKAAKETLDGADIVLKVRAPLRKGEGRVDELAAMERGAVLLGLLDPYDSAEAIAAYA
ncbi:MAG: NAD(P)(+) transhydrogenase (Re/Si-specific) subunit alpha, partial [Pseudomonadota bacterium]